MILLNARIKSISCARTSHAIIMISSEKNLFSGKYCNCFNCIITAMIISSIQYPVSCSFCFQPVFQFLLLFLSFAEQQESVSDVEEEDDNEVERGEEVCELSDSCVTSEIFNFRCYQALRPGSISGQRYLFQPQLHVSRVCPAYRLLSILWYPSQHILLRFYASGKRLLGR